MVKQLVSGQGKGVGNRPPRLAYGLHVHLSSRTPVDNAGNNLNLRPDRTFSASMFTCLVVVVAAAAAAAVVVVVVAVVDHHKVFLDLLFS